MLLWSVDGGADTYDVVGDIFGGGRRVVSNNDLHLITEIAAELSRTVK